MELKETQTSQKLALGFTNSAVKPLPLGMGI